MTVYYKHAACNTDDCFAEFENVLHCSSFQHPQQQHQPPYMMTAGAGRMKHQSISNTLAFIFFLTDSFKLLHTLKTHHAKISYFDCF